MTDQFVAEIRIFAGNFPPTGWALCDGQLLPISQNTALFSLLGTTYGGDGKSTFALPALQGRAPMHFGQGPGLSVYDLGEEVGVETVELLQSEIPAHTHAMTASADDVNTTKAGPTALGAVGRENYRSDVNGLMSPNAASAVGGSQPHNNMQPYLGLTFIIALQGIFPPRG